MSGEGNGRSDGRDDRRSAARLRLELPLEIHLPAGEAVQPRLVFAQLVDVGADGRGAAVRVPVRSRVPVGGEVSLLLEDDEPIRGIVVSRLGTARYERLGIRIHESSQAPVLGLAKQAASEPPDAVVATSAFPGT